GPPPAAGCSPAPATHAPGPRPRPHGTASIPAAPDAPTSPSVPPPPQPSAPSASPDPAHPAESTLLPTSEVHPSDRLYPGQGVTLLFELKHDSSTCVQQIDQVTLTPPRARSRLLPFLFLREVAA